MLKLLIDTSVWLDLAKDYRNLPLLTLLGDLVDRDEIELLVPEVVREEFARNRARVLASAKASQGEVFKRARNAVRQFGNEERKAVALRELDDVAHSLAIHGEASNESMQLVEKLLEGPEPIVASIIARQRAANRGLDRLAPFHGSKNSTADAVLIETYSELVEEDANPQSQFAFVTANTADFSAAGGDTRLPHADIASFFDGKRSRYATQLDELLRDPALGLPIDEDIDMMFYSEEPRLLSEITEAIDFLWHQVWHNRHRYFMAQIESGEVTVVDEMPSHRPYDSSFVTRATLATAKAAGERVAKAYEGQLGPWDDFEWGMITGKLSALRWAMGDEWDFLDT